MGLYNYLQGDKLLRDTLLLHKDIGPYERAVFSYLCLNTPDPRVSSSVCLQSRE